MVGDGSNLDVPDGSVWLHPRVQMGITSIPLKEFHVVRPLPFAVRPLAVSEYDRIYI